MRRAAFDHPLALIVCLMLAVSVVLPAQAGPGDLDVRFGTHGQSQVPGQVDSAALVALPDGRILVFGKPEGQAARDDGAIAVARLLANGKPDATFGAGGHLDLRLGSERRPIAMDAVLLADGRILVAGRFEEDGFPTVAERRPLLAGWLVRLSQDATIDSTFGVGGVARVGGGGVDRIALLADGAIAAAAPGMLHRLESNGSPAFFPGSEVSAVPTGSGYSATAMAAMQDGSVITSAGFSGPFDSLELFRISVSGDVITGWPWPHDVGGPGFSDVASLAPDRDGTLLMACGSSWLESLVVTRWQNDGRIDPAFAAATGNRVELGVETRPAFRGRRGREAHCRSVLPGLAQDHVLVGDWSNPYEYGGGRILLAHLNVFGAIDAGFDRSGRGREVALGMPDQWSSWYVADAASASDGAVLLIARRTTSPPPSDFYVPNELGEQRTLIARVEISPSSGHGSIGFNDAAVRVAERRPGELSVYRSGGSAGSVSVHYDLLHDTTIESDVAPTAGTLTWPDGDTSPRTISLVPVNDDALEGEERFRVRLGDPTGGAGLGAPVIEVTIEDDEALRAIQFAEPEVQIMEAESASLTLIPPATLGPITVRYAVAPDLDPNDGTPRPTDSSPLVYLGLVGELRWNAGDTARRTLQVNTFGSSTTDPNETIYVALADVSGTLREGNEWKVARVTVVDDPELTKASTPATPSQPPQRQSEQSGGGAISITALLVLALALLLRARPLALSSVVLSLGLGLSLLHFDAAIANTVGVVPNRDIVVTTSAGLESALGAANAGQLIRIRAGTYDLPRALVVPDHVTLVGEGRMQFDTDGLPSGFVPFTATILRSSAGLLGDVLTLGDGSVLRGLVIEDRAGRAGNVVLVSSRAEGDTVAATIAQCEIIAPNPRGVGPQGPTGHALAVVTGNLNLGAPPAPHVGSELSVEMRRTLIRSPGAAPGIIALGFASHSRIALVLTRNVIGAGLAAVAGVGRPDAVTRSTIAIDSAHNLYLASAPSNTSEGWRLAGGDTARLPLPSGSSTKNRIRMDSRDDRIEGFAVGIFAAAGARLGELAQPSSQNSADLELTRLRLQSTVADLALYGAYSAISGMSGGDSNTLLVTMHRSSGSGGLANEYADSWNPVLDELGVGNRLVVVGTRNAFARSNSNIHPLPPAQFFRQCR